MTTRVKALASVALLAAMLATAALADELPAVRWADWNALADAYGITLSAANADESVPDAETGQAEVSEGDFVVETDPESTVVSADDGTVEAAAAAEPGDTADPEEAPGAVEEPNGAGPAADEGAGATPDGAVDADAESTAEPAETAQTVEAAEGVDGSGGSELQFISVDGDAPASSASPEASIVPEPTDAPEAGTDPEASGTPEADAAPEASPVAGERGEEAGAGKWLITTAAVNLRREPTTKSASITTVTEGTPLYFLEQSTVDSRGKTWHSVRYGENDCWVSGDYVRERTQEDIDADANRQAAANGTKVVVKAGYNARLRQEPSLSSTSLGFLEGEAAYLGESRMDERSVLWYHVEANGKKGWVSSTLVTLQ